MEFILHNIGWFIGIGAIALLALIGYNEDKKEKKEKENNILKNEEPAQEEIKETIVPEPVPETVEQQEDYEKMPLFKNIEDTHMSMEDLEKTNYNLIINHEEQEENSYNYIEDPQSNQENLYSAIEESTIENNQDIYYDDYPEEDIIEHKENNNQIENNLESELYYEDNEETDEQKEIEDESDLHPFESEIEDTQNNYNYDSIPELGDVIPVSDNANQDEEESYLSDDNIDDDIWKF